ncbi:MAG: hypothetical protein UH654_11700, partial [Lachnospiraceae bacterium]|nr:hypothetical protein [Lachnospiraceae bacterium]
VYMPYIIICIICLIIEIMYLNLWKCPIYAAQLMDNEKIECCDANAKNIEYVKNTEYIKNIGYVKKAEYIKNIEYVKKAEYIKNIEYVKKAEYIKNTEYAENIDTDADMNILRSNLDKDITKLADGLRSEDIARTILNAYNYIYYNTEPKSDNSIAKTDSDILYNIYYNKIGDSEGYALFFKKLMDCYGYECQIEYGTSESGDNAWNVVKISGEWYYVNCYADDVAGTPENYCLAGSDRVQHGSYGDITLATVSYFDREVSDSDEDNNIYNEIDNVDDLDSNKSSNNSAVNNKDNQNNSANNISQDNSSSQNNGGKVEVITLDGNSNKDGESEEMNRIDDKQSSNVDNISTINGASKQRPLKRVFYYVSSLSVIVLSYVIARYYINKMNIE